MRFGRYRLINTYKHRVADEPQVHIQRTARVKMRAAIISAFLVIAAFLFVEVARWYVIAVYYPDTAFKVNEGWLENLKTMANMALGAVLVTLTADRPEHKPQEHGNHGQENRAQSDRG